jgi:hypothetical protein
MPFLLLCFLLQASGEPPTIQDASVFGTVIDQSSGEPLGKVRVILRGSELQTLTDGSGRYRIDGIRPGAYTRYVSSIGYRLIKKDIELAAGQSQEVVFYLGQEAATIQETVRVTAPQLARAVNAIRPEQTGSPRKQNSELLHVRFPGNWI